MCTRDRLDCSFHTVGDYCNEPIDSCKVSVILASRNMMHHTLRRWQASHARFVGTDISGNVVEAEDKRDIC